MRSITILLLLFATRIDKFLAAGDAAPGHCIALNRDFELEGWLSWQIQGKMGVIQKAVGEFYIGDIDCACLAGDETSAICVEIKHASLFIYPLAEDRLLGRGQGGRTAADEERQADCADILPPMT